MSMSTGTVLACPFCRCPMKAPRLEQIEADSYVAALDCSGCDLSVNTQYTEPTSAATPTGVAPPGSPPQG